MFSNSTHLVTFVKPFRRGELCCFCFAAAEERSSSDEQLGCVSSDCESVMILRMRAKMMTCLCFQKNDAKSVARRRRNDIVSPSLSSDSNESFFFLMRDKVRCMRVSKKYCIKFYFYWKNFFAWDFRCNLDLCYQSWKKVILFYRKNWSKNNSNNNKIEWPDFLKSFEVPFQGRAKRSLCRGQSFNLASSLSIFSCNSPKMTW